jgi:hypothetical protein
MRYPKTTYTKRIFNPSDQNQKKKYFLGKKRPPQHFISEAVIIKKST